MGIRHNSPWYTKKTMLCYSVVLWKENIPIWALRVRCIVKHFCLGHGRALSFKAILKLLNAVRTVIKWHYKTDDMILLANTKRFILLQSIKCSSSKCPWARERAVLCGWKEGFLEVDLGWLSGVSWLSNSYQHPKTSFSLSYPLCHLVRTRNVKKMTQSHQKLRHSDLWMFLPVFSHCLKLLYLFHLLIKNQQCMLQPFMR